MNDQLLWVEKYRPSSIEECILPQGLKDTFSEIVRTGELPNLLLTGGAGVGKTTVAKALCSELGMDHILINGSEDGNIDTLRTKIRHYASTVSFSSRGKVVILDEADYLNPQSTQPALRGFIEEFSANCRFILTCNFKNRIIEPLHSRCAVIPFTISNKDKPQLGANFFKRVRNILEQENIKYEPKVVADLIKKHFPDWRRVLNELQRYSIGGTIDVGMLNSIEEVSISDLVSNLKLKNYNEMRKWVTQNLDNDSTVIFRKVYDSLYEVANPSSVPQAVVTIAEYQYKSAFVADQEINMVACLTELMVECEWK
jgi:DNA polymerase III delta prime subunit|tara:strand:+ start:5213 stop:6151 length:939 start_codon:yes stop_codon:yes gene_type:complete